LGGAPSLSVLVIGGKATRIATKVGIEKLSPGIEQTTSLLGRRLRLGAERGSVVLDPPQHCKFEGSIALATRCGWSSTQPRSVSAEEFGRATTPPRNS